MSYMIDGRGPLESAPATNTAGINYQIDGRSVNQDYKIMGMTAQQAQTSLVSPAGNTTVAAAAATSAATGATVTSSAWTGTPYVSKRGNPIATKQVVVVKGKGAGKSRTVYGEYIASTGKYKRISLLEITSGKKPPRSKISSGTGRRKSRKGPRTEVQKGRAKFMRAETAEGRRRDRKLKAPLVTKARDYNPQTTDMKGVDYPRRR